MYNVHKGEDLEMLAVVGHTYGPNRRSHNVEDVAGHSAE